MHRWVERERESERGKRETAVIHNTHQHVLPLSFCLLACWTLILFICLRLCLFGHVCLCVSVCATERPCVFAWGCLRWRCQMELISCLLPALPGDGVLPRAESDRCRPILLVQERTPGGTSSSKRFPRDSRFNYNSWFSFFPVCLSSVVHMYRTCAVWCINAWRGLLQESKLFSKKEKQPKNCRSRRTKYPGELATLTVLWYKPKVVYAPESLRGT